LARKATRPPRTEATPEQQPSQENFPAVPVTTEQLDPCKVALTITVEPDKVRAARSKAYNEFARNVQIPGFRRGKVPPHLVRTYVDKDRVGQRAVEMLVGPAYTDALTEAQVEPFGNLEPELELVEMNDDGPLVFKAFVPLRPVITLGPYKGLEIERRIITIADEDVDRQIEEVLTRNADYPQVTDRAVETGDVILADIAVTVLGDEEDSSESRAAVIEVGKNIGDFDEGLVGMAIGETKNIDATYPEDFGDERLRGKSVVFTVTVNEIHLKVLPELNEEFVQKVHQTAKTPDEFRTAVREGLEKAATEMADNQVEFDIVNKVVGNSQIHFPDALLRLEMRADYGRLSEFLKERKIAFEDYLENEGLTREEFEASVGQSAAARVRNSLALSEVARAEGLTVEDADVDRLIEERAERSKVSVAAMKAFVEKNEQLPQLRDQALTEKILNFLKGEAIITDRMLTTEEARALSDAEEAAAGGATEVAAPAEPGEPAEAAAPLAVTAGVKGRRSKKAADAATETVTADLAGAEAEEAEMAAEAEVSAEPEPDKGATE
jgi:trigger factor